MPLPSAPSRQGRNVQKNTSIPSLTGRGRGVRLTFSTNIVSLTGHRKTIIAYLFRIPKLKSDVSTRSLRSLGRHDGTVNGKREGTGCRRQSRRQPVPSSLTMEARHVERSGA
ncbi:MAG: hypothetical protein LBS25_03470 [Candidatus Symbiothrix sp.]|nr:hypothetical protein [Candidatus Symbiothrix sp.]